MIVTPALGGTILGFDVDQKLYRRPAQRSAHERERKLHLRDRDVRSVNGQSHRDQEEKIRDLRRRRCHSGIIGSSVGLVKHQHSPTFDHLRLTFPVLNSAGGQSHHRRRLSPFKKTAEIESVSRNQDAAMNAFQVYDFATSMEYVFGSDVAQNKVGPVLQITSIPGIIGLNTATNTAVVAIANENDFGPPYIGQIALAHGKVKSFQGLGSGNVQGLAVDLPTILR